MATLPSLEEQIATAGITYSRRHDISYRAGLVMQVVGAGALAVLYPLANPFYSAGIMLFELGVLISAVYLLVWISWVKTIILGATTAGILVQVLGYYAPPEYAGTVIILGIGLVCLGAAGLAGREAYCFAWREGWALMWLYAVMVLVNLVVKESVPFNAAGFSAIFLLLLSLAGKKLRQPVLTSCAENVCGIPDKKNF